MRRSGRRLTAESAEIAEMKKGRMVSHGWGPLRSPRALRLVLFCLLASCGGVGGWFGKPIGVEFSPGSLSFEADEGGAGPAAQTVAIDVTPDGLDWTATTTATWLSVTPTAGNGDSTLEVSVARLLTGDYEAEVVVDCPETGLGPFSLSVTLRADIGWYVDIDAPGATHDGKTWATAFLHPQDGVDAASSGGEVWVAEGTYIRQTGSDTVLLTMKDGVGIYGGFAGTEASRDERDPAAHVTTLDGETVVYHVVMGASNATLDGFTVTRGNADGGGGDNDGAGMYNPTGTTNLAVADCTFSNNSAGNDGAGMKNHGCSSIITNCVFAGNSANDDGGGVHNCSGSTPIFRNCIFSGNTAPNGGAMRNYDAATVTVVNCTFSDNTGSVQGGGICNANTTSDSTLIVTNSIFWGNTAPTGPQFYDNGTGSYTLSYCDIQGGHAGTGNIDADPLFVGGGDYHLQSTSPCIDTGTILGAPETDLDGVIRPSGGGVDMGAYERAAANVWYVDATRPDDTGAGDSWATAKRTIQAANALAGAGDEIWVADGTYTNNGDGTATVLVMKDGVGYFGGFQGNESIRTARDPDTYTTTLDGENNAYHVVTGASKATLDGFTVTRGNAVGVNPEDRGGGMLNDGVLNLTVASCRFEGNSAKLAAGMWNNNSSPTVSECVFDSNSSANSGGGGMRNDLSSPYVSSCMFVDNSGDWGAGMCNVESSPTVDSCIFSGNSAPTESSGGMRNYLNCSPIIVNCVFVTNSADNATGGGMTNTSSCSPMIVNCTFADNSSSDGGAIKNELNSSATVTNCILWENTAATGPEVSNDGTSSCAVSYSDVGQAGGFTDAGGNLNVVPLFVDAAGGDLRLQAGSPCIDAADGDAAPATDIEGNARYDDPGTTDTGVGAVSGVTWADMGAYEFQE